MNTKYNFFDIQKQVVSYWQHHNSFKTTACNDKKQFIIDTPPPTVSGNLHIGHIFSYTHQDIIARYKRMSNFNVIYPFGFDDNGLPTERFVEKKRNITVAQCSREEFIAICLEEIKPIHQKFIELWTTIGLSCDWELIYSTISKETQCLSQKSFIDLYKKGYIYKKNEPALYCTAFRTSISQADLEEIEKKTTINTVVFKHATDNSDILIATTRPELLAGCVAVLIHPDDSRFNHLIGQMAIVPLYNHKVPIIGDELVIPEKGTGIVMSATFGDALDVTWFKKHNFTYKKIINNDGTLTENTLFLAGMKVEAARAVILEKLEQHNLLIKKEEITHRVSVYERSKKEIEYVMLNQWFISILPLKEKFLALADEINWHPEYMKHRYIDWVKKLSWDWCISRQRAFGIPFPVWYDKNDAVILAKINDLPVDPVVQLPDGYTAETCFPDNDVMDTWNTSSLTPYIIQALLAKKNITIDMPLSMRPQSHDIIRTWAFDTIVKAYLTEEKLPWTDIVISGHVLTPDKEKISKSKGNSPHDPDNLIKMYPADVIRYWTASAKLGVDTTFSDTQMKDGNRLIIKLLNASLCIEKFSIFNAHIHLNTSEIKEAVNIFFIAEFQKTMSQYHDYFTHYDYNGALKTLEKYFWFFCDHYLELIKPYQYKSNLFTPEQVEETKHISGYLFFGILQGLAPFLPFITEHLFQMYFNRENHITSIHHTLWQQIPNTDNLSNSYFTQVIASIELVRKAKSELQYSLKTKIDRVVITTSSKALFSYLETNITLHRLLLILHNTSHISYKLEKNTEITWKWNNRNEHTELFIFLE
jgi:valyl-tRNA synthetase